MTPSITLTPKIMEVGATEPALLLGGTDADLPRLLAEADFVVVAVPLLPATRGMIGVKDGGLAGYLLQKKTFFSEVFDVWAGSKAIHRTVHFLFPV